MTDLDEHYEKLRLLGRYKEAIDPEMMKARHEFRTDENRVSGPMKVLIRIFPHLTWSKDATD